MALVAMGGALFSALVAWRVGPLWLPGVDGWSPVRTGLSPAWIAAVFFALPALALFILALRPAIEIGERCLRIGRREIPWLSIRRVDQTGWNVPLVVRLRLQDQSRVLVLYPADFDSAAILLRYLRRYARGALLDGVPDRQFWGEPSSPEREPLPPRYKLLRKEDEEEV